MATVTHAVSTANTNNLTSYASGAFTPAAGDLLVCMIVKSASVNVGTLSDDLGDGGGWVPITSALYDVSTNLVVLFVRDKLVSATSMFVTYDCAGDSATGCIIQVARVSGMSLLGSAAVRQSAIQENQVVGTTPAEVFAAVCLTDNPTLTVVGNKTNPAGITQPTGWTLQNDTGYATPDTGADYASRDGGFTGTTITWGSTSASRHGSIAVELGADTMTSQVLM